MPVENTEAVAAESTVEQVAAEQASTVEFTDRELALMSGQDPDRVSESGSETETTSETTLEKTGREASEDRVAAPESGRIPVSASDAAGGGKDAADKTTWYSDEHREYAASYGLSEQDLGTFANEQEFRRAAALLDRQFAQAAARALQAEANPSTDKDGVQKPAEAAKTDDGEIDPDKYLESGHDELIVKLAKALKSKEQLLKEVTDKVSAVESGMKEFREQAQRQVEVQRHAAKLNRFHDTVDKLSEGLFGRSCDENGRLLDLPKEANENRQKLFEVTDIIIKGIEASAKEAGREPVYPSYDMLIKRAQYQLFADEIRREEQERLKTSIRQQAVRRRPVSASRGVPSAAARSEDRSPADQEVERLKNHPAIRNMWDQMSEESGN